MCRNEEMEKRTGEQNSDKTLCLWLSSPDNALSEVRVVLARAHLASELGAVHRDFLLAPPQKLARHVQYVSLRILLEGGLHVAANFLELGVLGPAAYWDLEFCQFSVQSPGANEYVH